MKQECLFDKKKDLCEVEQFGFVDTVKAEASGFIPPDLSPSVDSFDGVEVDPESIIGKPHDAFEAMRMQDRLAEGIRKENKKEVNKTDSYNKTEKS